MPKKSIQNPVDIAREVFHQLAMRRIAPTPEAYRATYEKISGSQNEIQPTSVLTTFAIHLARQPGDIGKLGQRLAKTSESGDWKNYGKELDSFVEQYLPVCPPVRRGELVPINLERQFLHDNNKEKMLRDVLVRILVFNLASLLQQAPELASESKAIGTDLKAAFSEQVMNEVIGRIKQLSFQIELKAADVAQQQELLLRLFQLLLENIHELLEKGSWLSNQISAVQGLIAAPISKTSLADTTKALKDVIYQQGLLKNTLREEKLIAQNLMLTFVDRLSAMASSTDHYHKTMTSFSQQISQASDISDLNAVLNGILNTTKEAQGEVLRSRDEIINARKKMHTAQARIEALESQLQHMGDLVHEDQLTGSLNRGSIGKSLEREIMYSDQHSTPLCIALLDLDDFKRINHTHGHVTGDAVLVHLVKTIKDALRKLDLIARFGGEEFLVLLPQTEPDEAMLIMTRVQRELTKRIFLHDKPHLLITFSAGVAYRHAGESQINLINRVEAALYKAKIAGKNRVILAD